jgi:glycosyltransferase involved in cell wall biosynthesis
MRVAGFLKVRNEIVREGNLYRVLAQLDQLCDGGVICDDASTDGTREHLEAWTAVRPQWMLLHVRVGQSFQNEMAIKQQMLGMLHTRVEVAYDWILWQDGDELFDQRGMEMFRPWLEEHTRTDVDVWSFHYTQLWRSASWARIDQGFDEGWFWKLWRYRSDLSFEVKDGLHHAQMPVQYLGPAVAAAHRGGSLGNAQRCPFEIIHAGNYGKNLVWKAIQYRNSGPLEQASLSRHLYFTTPQYRRVDTSKFAPQGQDLLIREEQPVPFTDQELRLIESMGTLRKQPGLFVIIVPTYNRGYKLEETMRSVFEQTDQRWVCIVLDDGSTDFTPALMRAWQDKDPRFFYCRYPENRGGVAMNEIGMNLAIEMGEYWVRLGSDDRFMPQKLELDRMAFEGTGSAGVVWGPYRDQHETFIGTDLRNPPTDARAYLQPGGFAVSWANIAVRTSVLEALRTKYGNFCPPTIRNMEDYVVNVRLSHVADFCWRGRIAVGVHGERVFFMGIKELPAGAHMRDVEHDAIWRIGADGASQKTEQCALDAAETQQVLSADRHRGN